MHKDKLEVFRGLWKQEKTPAHKELERQAEILVQEAALIKGLMRHDGWKLLDEFFQKKQKVLALELKTCKQKDLIRLQERAKVIDEFYSFLYSKIVRDPDL